MRVDNLGDALSCGLGAHRPVAMAGKAEQANERDVGEKRKRERKRSRRCRVGVGEKRKKRDRRRQWRVGSRCVLFFLNAGRGLEDPGNTSIKVAGTKFLQKTPYTTLALRT
jgi:hypothetical protein